MSRPHPELGPPPALAANGLRVVPLGGIGEIGRNMTVFEHAGKLLVVDCGVLFPEDEQPGVDLILPDFASITDTRTTSAGSRTCCARSRTSRWSVPGSLWRWSRPSCVSTASSPTR